MSAQAGWYPDPGGGQDLYRFWDGHSWSAATSTNPAAPAPQGLLGAATPPPPTSGQPAATGQPGYGGGGYQPMGGFGAPGGYGGQAYGQGSGAAYAQYQHPTQKRRSNAGWWIGGAALLVVLALVGVFVVRGVTGAGGGGLTNPGGGQASQDVCPPQVIETASPAPGSTDGRVHGGPISYPELSSPWEPPQGDTRVPFGRDVRVQQVVIEPEYQPDSSWVASVLVAELNAGDGFFTPEQGSQIVVKCILGKFYGDAAVQSDVKVNKATTIDGHPGWIVESQLSFDIEGLKTKGELLIVAIVSTGTKSGLYYASIPDTAPELVGPARDSLAALKVDG